MLLAGARRCSALCLGRVDNVPSRKPKLFIAVGLMLLLDALISAGIWLLLQQRNTAPANQTHPGRPRTQDLRRTAQRREL